MTTSFERIRVLWPDHLGLARGKYVPASLAEQGVRHCTGTWALGYDRGMTPETPGSHWHDGLPDFGRSLQLDRHPPKLGGEHQGRRGEFGARGDCVPGFAPLRARQGRR